ncbi:MAG: hypothetical protein HGA85_08235 [Nanoarchaeota archaeon]|nr:hypothetical protein [Nanoarchaeota archaeon]
MLTVPYVVMSGDLFIGSIEPNGKLCSPMVDYLLSDLRPHITQLSQEHFHGLAADLDGIFVKRFDVYMPTTAYKPYLHEDEQVMAFAPILNAFYGRDDSWVRRVQKKGLLFYSHGNSQSGKVELTSVSIGYPTPLTYWVELFYQERYKPEGSVPLNAYLQKKNDTTIQLESAVDFGRINKQRLQVFEEFLDKLDKTGKPDKDGKPDA